MIAYSSNILNDYIQVARLALPSLRITGTQDMSSTLLEKGAAIEASESARETPTSATLSAEQSLAPFPHIMTYLNLCPFYSDTRNSSTISAFCSGLILAKTCVFLRRFLKTCFLDGLSLRRC